MSQVDTYRERMNPAPRIRQRWARVEKTGDNVTLSDFMRAAMENCNGLDPTIGGGVIMWTSPETAEEVQQRIAAAQAGLDRHLAAIKGMHDEYTALGLYEEKTDHG